MTEVACYTMHLYCDNVLPLAWPRAIPGKQHLYDEFPREFTGRTYADVKREAKQRGWRWWGGKNICPRCSRAKRLKQAIKAMGDE